jgi:hypothetical protein
VELKELHFTEACLHFDLCLIDSLFDENDVMLLLVL